MQAGRQNNATPAQPHSYESTLAHLKEHGQEHILAFYHDLASDDQERLLAQIASIDVPRVNMIFKKALASAQAAAENGQSSDIKPLPESATASVVGPSNQSNRDKWYDIGLQAIQNGQVGLILMAGGQGTRLGSSAPKGCYDIGLPSRHTLFQMQAERIRKLNQLAGVDNVKGKGVPWYVMTSGPTRQETEKYFRSNNYFGLDKNDVIFFDQGVLPALTNDGKIYLQDKSTIAVAPDGNGGLYAALRQPLPTLPNNQSVLEHMASRGIKHIHAYCVDNCLVNVADPVFVGYSMSNNAECGAKVVVKKNAKESVGVLAVRDGTYSVVEYSELSPQQAELVDPKTGELAFRAANIANHYFTLDFLNKMEEAEKEMVFHIARKKIAHVDTTTGETIKPSSPNGMKLELFVFDVFSFTSQLSVLEVDRAREFSPLKNAPGTGVDDPSTSRRDILAEHARWLTEAGAVLESGVEVEILPTVSYAGEGLEAFKGKKLTQSITIDTLDIAKKL